jgi:nickel-dependent lactate racemase
MVWLPYGRAPLQLDLGGHQASILELPAPPPPRPLAELVDHALAAPIGRPPIERLAAPNARVTVIVSDVTRAEPRAAFLAALRARLPSVRLTIAIATGTHGPCGISALDLPSQLLAGATIVDHDGHSDADLVSLGITSRGTEARVHRCVVDADLVVATGCIRPHYFAGFGAGVKAIFPGLGAARDIRQNHELKQLAGARAGIVVGNPCREDLEEAVGLLRVPTFLLNGVCDARAQIQAVVAGDLVAAFHAGVALARPYFTVTAEPADVVIASDTLPVTASLYQAAKIAAAVAPLVRARGLLVIAAECPDGIGPLEVVNEKIFKIGVLPRLAPEVRLVLLSQLAADDVRETLLAPITIEAVMSELHQRTLIVPHASQMLIS